MARYGPRPSRTSARKKLTASSARRRRAEPFPWSASFMSMAAISANNADSWHRVRAWLLPARRSPRTDGYVFDGPLVLVLDLREDSVHEMFSWPDAGLHARRDARGGLVAWVARPYAVRTAHARPHEIHARMRVPLRAR